MTALPAPATNRLTRLVLRVPLFAKLIGANAIVVVIAGLALWGPVGRLAPRTNGYDYLITGALAAGVLVNIALVWLALRPVHELQRVAGLVAKGAFGERVHKSALADKRLGELTDATNLMLERLAADRDRMRKLSADVMYAQEEERAQVAHDLHDSVAQTLAAAVLETGALLRAATEPGVRAKLQSIRELLGSALEELRAVSQSLHPRVADDLGLSSALESLARMTRERSLIDVNVTTNLDDTGIPSALSTTLYRVAREALRSIERRADAGTVSISLSTRNGLIELTITDDSCESDSRKKAASSDSSALRLARERLSLAGGEVHIDSGPNGGTRIVARISTNRRVA